MSQEYSFEHLFSDRGFYARQPELLSEMKNAPNCGRGLLIILPYTFPFASHVQGVNVFGK